MIKTREELNAIKEEFETLNGKLNELTEEELAQVIGGVMMQYDENANETPALKNLKQRAGKPLDIVE